MESLNNTDSLPVTDATVMLDHFTKLRTNAANSDMTRARKNGSHIITGTPVGVIELLYSQVSKRYSARKFNTGEMFFTSWSAAAARTWMAKQYVVINLMYGTVN
jgi:hypothetical protein